MGLARRATDEDGAPEGGRAQALDLPEVVRRPPSLGLVAKIVGLTLLGAGAVFSFGMAWGRSTTDEAAALQALREEDARQKAAAGEARAELKAQLDTARGELRAQVDSNAARLKVLEGVAGGLTPAVDRLGTQVDKLAGTVDALRMTVTEQNVELRHMKETLLRLEGNRAAVTAPTEPTARPR